MRAKSKAHRTTSRSIAPCLATAPSRRSGTLMKQASRRSVRDRLVRSRQLPPEPAFDVFISHASEDTEAVALPLYGELLRRGLRVWLDRTELTLGDSLSRKIDQGLARSTYGVVIVSKAFLRKEWPQRELNGLVARQTIDRRKAILPVWHQVTPRQVLAFSPTLADQFAANTRSGIPRVADGIAAAVRAGRQLTQSERTLLAGVLAAQERNPGSRPDPLAVGREVLPTEVSPEAVATLVRTLVQKGLLATFLQRDSGRLNSRMAVALVSEAGIRALNPRAREAVR